MKTLQEKIDKTLSKINEKDLVRSNVISEQAVSQKCDRNENEAIRFIFNSNPKVKWVYKDAIDNILKRVFSEKYRDEGDLVGGVYDLEGKGRSVINKMNTNYSCYCVLMKDINQFLVKAGSEPISVISETPMKQIVETKRMMEIVDRLGERIFSPTSLTFQNVMSILERTHKLGEEREEKTMKILKKKFGEENVQKIGGIGSKEDMISGIDLIITDGDEKYSAQVKPMSSMETKDGVITVYGTGGVKKYTTDWIIFTTKDLIHVFENDNTKIINGNFTFDESALIYSLY